MVPNQCRGLCAVPVLIVYTVCGEKSCCRDNKIKIFFRSGEQNAKNRKSWVETP